MPFRVYSQDSCEATNIKGSPIKYMVLNSLILLGLPYLASCCSLRNRPLIQSERLKWQLCKSVDGDGLKV